MAYTFDRSLQLSYAEPGHGRLVKWENRVKNYLYRYQYYHKSRAPTGNAVAYSSIQNHLNIKYDYGD